MSKQLTKAQTKLLHGMAEEPLKDALQFLDYIRNPLIRNNLISSLHKFGYLRQDEMGKYHLSGNAKEALPPEPVVGDVDFSAAENAPQAEKEPLTGNARETLASQAVAVSELDGSDGIKKVNKKAMLLEMLKSSASIEEMVKATGWKDISARGVLSQLKKEKNLTIIRTKRDGKQNFYTLVETKAGENITA